MSFKSSRSFASFSQLVTSPSAVARRLGLATLSLSALTLAACGPNYLTPDQVRGHIENPGGEVSSSTVGFATDDIFRAKRASSAEANAFFLKGTTGAVPMQSAASFANPVADAFCTASLVASIAAFDDCTDGTDNCEAEFVIDSCVLQLGEDGGDVNADGRIRFLISNSNEGGVRSEELRITFEGFSSSLVAESSDPAEFVEQFDGIIAVASTQTEDDSRNEVIFSADIDYSTRVVDPGFFEDGIVERTRLTAAMRYLEESGEDFETGSLDLLAFVDDTDDTRDESVVLTFATESRRIDSLELTNATLELTGSNGSFLCTFNSAEETLGDETASYSSAGNCLDRETGEEFNWTSAFDRDPTS